MRPVWSITILAAAAFIAGGGAAGDEGAGKPVCPVTRKETSAAASSPQLRVNGKPVYFCSAACVKTFARTPEKYVQAADNCPVMGSKAVVTADLRVSLNNELFYFC